MRVLKILIIAMVLVFVFTGCYLEDDGPSGVVREEKTLTFKGADQLKLRNVTGGIKVIGWDNDYVEVTYIKKAASDTLLERLRVEARQKGSLVDIDTDYPRKCRRCRISFSVFVPRSMEKIGIRTVTGTVSLAGMDYVDDVLAKTVTGSVTVGLSCRDCELSSVTGDIRADFEKIDDSVNIEASLTTGSVKIVLPDDFGGQVRLQTVTGSVYTDFPVTMTGRLKKTRINGSIGEGSSIIRAGTVTGSIRLLKKKSE
jgi:hypothetical protein